MPSAGSYGKALSSLESAHHLSLGRETSLNGNLGGREQSELEYGQRGRVSSKSELCRERHPLCVARAPVQGHIAQMKPPPRRTLP